MAPTIKGKVVQYGEHLKVKIVSYGEDLRVIPVDYGEDMKIKIVNWEKTERQSSSSIEIENREDTTMIHSVIA